MLKDNHIGQFLIPLKLINDYPDKVKEFMSDMIIIKAEMDFAARGVIYTAINENVFLELTPGMQSTWYELDVIYYKDKDPDIAIKKVGEYSY